MKTYSRLRASNPCTNLHPAKRRRTSDSDSRWSRDGLKALADASQTSSSPPPTTPQQVFDISPCANDSTPQSSPPPSSVPASVTKNAIPVRRLAFPSLARKGSAAHKAATTSSGTPSNLYSTSRNLSSTTGTKPTLKKLVQTQLDLGGSLHRTCRVCGMEFIPSSTEDVALHKKFHAMNVGGVDLGRVPDADKLWRGSEGAYVLAVGPTSYPGWKRRAEKVLEVVHKDLGAVTIPGERLWEEISEERKEEREAGEKRQRGAHRHKVFLYVQGGKCVGLCLAERISEAYGVLPDSTGIQEDKMSANLVESSSLSTSLTPCPALIGISRIWTSSSHRRKGVAQTLLDCACRDFLYGIAIEKEMAAFSQPTESGARLARHWFGKKHGWKVYSESGERTGDLTFRKRRS